MQYNYKKKPDLQYQSKHVWGWPTLNPPVWDHPYCRPCEVYSLSNHITMPPPSQMFGTGVTPNPSKTEKNSILQESRKLEIKPQLRDHFSCALEAALQQAEVTFKLKLLRGKSEAMRKPVCKGENGAVLVGLGWGRRGTCLRCNIGEGNKNSVINLTSRRELRGTGRRWESTQDKDGGRTAGTFLLWVPAMVHFRGLCCFTVTTTASASPDTIPSHRLA